MYLAIIEEIQQPDPSRLRAFHLLEKRIVSKTSVRQLKESLRVRIFICRRQRLAIVLSQLEITCRTRLLSPVVGRQELYNSNEIPVPILLWQGRSRMPFLLDNCTTMVTYPLIYSRVSWTIEACLKPNQRSLDEREALWETLSNLKVPQQPSSSVLTEVSARLSVHLLSTPLTLSKIRGKRPFILWALSQHQNKSLRQTKNTNRAPEFYLPPKLINHLAWSMPDSLQPCLSIGEPHRSTLATPSPPILFSTSKIPNEI